MLIITITSCKAQSPVVTLDDITYETQDGAYFKDTNNEFNKFEGTWVYTNGNAIFTIVLQKKEMIFNGTDYEDLLIGEYKYEEDGVELVNTLPLLDDSSIVGHYHSISGNSILSNENIPVCDDCSLQERRVDLFIDDPLREYLSGALVLRYLTDSSPEQIEVLFYSNGGGPLLTEDSPILMRAPYGEYTFTKQ